MAQKNSETIDRTGKPYYRVNDKGEYRLEQDARLLPPELKEFRKRIENKLLSDPDSDYCKIYNAARIRYAWAMTVNKAMADTFEHVYFDTSQGETHGRTNKDTFKWLYTGFAAAACTITLINWQPISPFMHTSYNSQSGSAVPKARSCIYVFTDSDQARETEFADVINTRLAQTRWQLADLSPRPYLMIAKLQNGETILELFFDYNGKGEVRRPRLKAGNPDDLGEIIDALAESTDARAEAGIGMSCFDGLIGLLDSRGIQGAVRNAAKWCAHGTFSRADEAVDVLCWYDSQGMISQFNRVSGSIELFDEIVTIIKETYT
jgi:hypothetical protein